MRGWLCPLLSAEMGARSQSRAGELLGATRGPRPPLCSALPAGLRLPQPAGGFVAGEMQCSC